MPCFPKSFVMYFILVSKSFSFEFTGCSPN
uniref:Uncharacterized protein n=1 Tax=Arundo donax TaxID=35708 RepID=A0A0A8YB25_ARUDO